MKPEVVAWRSRDWKLGGGMPRHSGGGVMEEPEIEVYPTPRRAGGSALRLRVEASVFYRSVPSSKQEYDMRGISPGTG